MTDRIIEISDTAARLSLYNKLMRINLPDGREVTVPAAEIQCLILANPAVTISGALLSALANAGCMVLISGPDRLPCAMQLPLIGNYVQTERFRAQANATRPLLKRLWQTVVKEKIRRQCELLEELKNDDFGLRRLIDKVNSGDTENIEGRAARIYWEHIFNRKFLRDRSLPDNNLLLNYGYAVLRAMTARACCGAGLHPTLGINHHNRYDPFCLADDLMEPFRPVVDRKVFQLNPDNDPITELTREYREKLLEILLEKIPTSKGSWQLSDLLKTAAGEVADSFVSGEMKLKYY